MYEIYMKKLQEPNTIDTIYNILTKYLELARIDDREKYCFEDLYNVLNDKLKITTDEKLTEARNIIFTGLTIINQIEEAELENREYC